MTDPEQMSVHRPGAGRLGVASPLAAAALYALAVLIATYPAALRCRTHLPTLTDPLKHIWTMAWYRTCLAEGRSPLFCNEIQHPVGAPLGHMPPMHLQSLVFVPISCATGNDILAYNIVWYLAFLLMGMGTFALAWHVLRSRAAATVAGLAGMLGTPMLWFAHSELEQMSVGTFPLFLVAWMRWVDYPSAGRLLGAVAGFLLMAMAAPYFMVLGVFPAGLYLAWAGVREGRRAIRPFVRERLAGLLAFPALTLPVLIALFSPQIWAAAHGFTVQRNETDFARLGAPIWGYVLPLPPRIGSHVLMRFLGLAGVPEPMRIYQASGLVGTVQSYLGIVTLGLIAVAAAARVRFREAGFLWVGLAMLVVLSLGASIHVGGVDVPLPGLVLREYFLPFRLIRVPARFNLFASVFAAVLAGAGLRHLLSKIRHPVVRVALLVGAGTLLVADLAMTPFGMARVPELPGCYAELVRDDPDATILDVPQFNPGAFSLPSICTYWQSLHRATTAAGSTAFRNDRCDDLVTDDSPFNALRMAQPEYLADPSAEPIGILGDVDAYAYTWLYLQHHRFDYVVVHHAPGSFPELPVQFERVGPLLACAFVSDDGERSVYDRARLDRPTAPALLLGDGWGRSIPWRGRPARLMSDRAELAYYNPEPDTPRRLVLEAGANRGPRRVQLLADGIVLQEWTVPPGDPVRLESPLLTMPAGVGTLELRCDDAPPARGKLEQAAGSPLPPFGLLAFEIRLSPADETSSPSPAIAVGDAAITR